MTLDMGIEPDAKRVHPTLEPVESRVEPRTEVVYLRVEPVEARTQPIDPGVQAVAQVVDPSTQIEERAEERRSHQPYCRPSNFFHLGIENTTHS